MEERRAKRNWVSLSLGLLRQSVQSLRLLRGGVLDPRVDPRQQRRDAAARTLRAALRPSAQNLQSHTVSDPSGLSFHLTTIPKISASRYMPISRSRNL